MTQKARISYFFYRRSLQVETGLAHVSHRLQYTFSAPHPLRLMPSHLINTASLPWILLCSLKNTADESYGQAEKHEGNEAETVGFGVGRVVLEQDWAWLEDLGVGNEWEEGCEGRLLVREHAIAIRIDGMTTSRVERCMNAPELNK